MKKEGYRLVVSHRRYDHDGAGALANDVAAALQRQMSVKTFMQIRRETLEAAGRTTDAEFEAEARARHDAAQQVLVADADGRRVAWGNLAHAAQVQAGAQPAAHQVVAFVFQPPTAAVRAARIDPLFEALAAGSIVAMMASGAVVSELYEAPTSSLATTKLVTGHAAALAAAHAALCVAMRGNGTVVAHAAIVQVLTDAILENWRTNIQGYTADELASAAISAIELVLVRPITMSTIEDSLVQHFDAFQAVNNAATGGFSERLVASMLRACEPGLQSHLKQTVPNSELVRNARLGAVPFVRFVVEHAELAKAKQVAVAALEITVASLRAEQSRLEARLTEHGRSQQQQQQLQQQGPQQAQRRQQRQQLTRRNEEQRERGRQVVGSPDYTGCNFVLPSGALCGNPGHARIDHPG